MQCGFFKRLQREQLLLRTQRSSAWHASDTADNDVTGSAARDDAAAGSDVIVVTGRGPSSDDADRHSVYDNDEDADAT